MHCEELTNVSLQNGSLKPLVCAPIPGVEGCACRALQAYLRTVAERPDMPNRCTPKAIPAARQAEHALFKPVHPQ